MILQHNMAAMTTNRQVGITNGKLAKSTQKLSTGYRINTAADDAAGLGISEKMRNLVRGLDQASENMDDAISLVHVADGAMGEIHSILQRVSELCVKGGNDTNRSEDRAAIQQEIDDLLEEITSITDKTTFNNIEVLKGRDPVTTPIFGISGSLPAFVLGSADGGIGNSTSLGSLSAQVPITHAAYSSTITQIVDATNTPVNTIQTASGTYTVGNPYSTNSSTPLLGTSATTTPVTGNISTPIYDINGNAYTIEVEESYTPQLKNHVAAYLDFSQVDSTNINQLLNTGFHSTCCTCDNRYSIKFVDTGDRIDQQGDNYIYEIDINGITNGNDLINKILPALGYSSNSTLDGNGNAFTTYQPQNHYTKYAAEKDALGNPTGRLLLFDERDNVSPGGSYGLFNEGIYEIQRYATAGIKFLNIQSGANEGEGVELYLPNTELHNLGLDGTVSVSSHSLASRSIGSKMPSIW